MIHGYNVTNVKKENIKGYAGSIGKTYIIIGITMLTLLIFVITNNDNYECIGTIVFMVGFVIAIVIIIKTQKKYKFGIWN